MNGETAYETAVLGYVRIKNNSGNSPLVDGSHPDDPSAVPSYDDDPDGQFAVTNFERARYIVRKFHDDIELLSEAELRDRALRFQREL